jgi:hypothetical protein
MEIRDPELVGRKIHRRTVRLEMRFSADRE